MKRWFVGMAALALVAALAACSSSARLTVELGSSGDTVIRGDTISVPVLVPDASGTVSLSVDGAPAGVTATLADTTLGSGATTTTLEVQVTPAASEGSATLRVVATAGENTASATFDLTVASLPLAGKVLDLYGNGMPGALVYTQGTLEITDADGAFAFDGVAVPYDLVVKQTVGGHPLAQVFEGLTTGAPMVVPYAAFAGMSMPAMSATLSGTLSAAVATGYEARVCVQSASTSVRGCGYVAAGATSYSFPVRWHSGTSLPVTVYAVEVATDAQGAATGYGRYGTAAGDVSDGGASTIDVTWGPAPSAAAFSADVTAPSTYTFTDAMAAVDLDPSQTLPVFQAHTASPGALPGTLVAIVPDLGSAGYTLAVAARQDGTTGQTIGWRHGVSAGSSLTFDLPAPPTPAAPADGATGVGVGTTLSLSSSTGAATFYLSSPSHVIMLTTMNDHTTVPDLGPVGMAFGTAESFTWNAFVSPEVTSPEEAAADWLRPYGLSVVAAQAGGVRPDRAGGTMMITPSRTFTTP